MSAKVNLLTAAPEVMKVWTGAALAIAASLEPVLIAGRGRFVAASCEIYSHSSDVHNPELFYRTVKEEFDARPRHRDRE